MIKVIMRNGAVHTYMSLDRRELEHGRLIFTNAAGVEIVLTTVEVAEVHLDRQRFAVVAAE